MRLIFSLVFFLGATASLAQQSPLTTHLQAAQANAALPDAPDPFTQQTSGKTDTSPSVQPENKSVPVEHQQPKRILGIMPNYRAVSAGAIPPPPTPRQAFRIATDNSFDYSSFVFVGLTSMIAEGDDSHSQLGKGIPGFWAM